MYPHTLYVDLFESCQMSFMRRSGAAGLAFDASKSLLHEAHHTVPETATVRIDRPSTVS